jgi:hypothetical protein
VIVVPNPYQTDFVASQPKNAKDRLNNKRVRRYFPRSAENSLPFSKASLRTPAQFPAATTQGISVQGSGKMRENCMHIGDSGPDP